jgi:uncharacterized protein YcnI
MVQAYTLSDRIVQQGYNDIQSLVGLVFKRHEGGLIELSSYDELKASNAQQIPVGQVAAYSLDSTEFYDTFIITDEILTDPSNSNILTRVSQAWAQGGKDQWLQIRRFESSAVVDLSGLSAPAAILYKIVVDAFLSTAP